MKKRTSITQKAVSTKKATSKAAQPLGRKRIHSFSFKTSNGTRALYEEDYFTRDEFLKERRAFINEGIKIRDTHTRKPFRPYDKR